MRLVRLSLPSYNPVILIRSTAESWEAELTEPSAQEESFKNNRPIFSYCHAILGATPAELQMQAELELSL